MKKVTPVMINSSNQQQFVSLFQKEITVHQFKDVTQNQYAHSSCLAMVKDWNLFLTFCHSRHVASLPASTTAVRLFLEHEARSRKYATVRRYSITVSVIHQLCGLSDPTNHNQVRKVLMQLRLDKHGDNKQADTFTAKHLEQMDKALGKSKEAKEIRDLAIYHVMFECALKRGELKMLPLDQIRWQNKEAIVSINDSSYALSESGSKALARWLGLLNGIEGTAFRAINRHGTISDKPLDDSSIYRILRAAGERIGQPQLQFSGQSTRIGAVKELAKQGLKAKEIQSFGRWLSPAMPYQYLGDKNTAEREKIRFLSIKPWE